MSDPQLTEFNNLMVRVENGPSSGPASATDYTPLDVSIPATVFAPASGVSELASIQMGELELARIAGADAHKAVNRMMRSVTEE
jgi:hypothetical protein